MVFKDQLVRCGACGKTFVYTVREQRYRADRGQSTEAPVFCTECRGADVRLAEAVERPVPAGSADEPRSEIGRSSGMGEPVVPRDRPSPRSRDAGRAGPRDDIRGRAREGGPVGGSDRRGLPGADRRGPADVGRSDDRVGPRRDRPERRGPDDGRGRGGPRSPQRRGGSGGGRPRAEPSRQTELRLRHFGTVKWFDREKGFGFIAQDDGGEIFVHMTGVIAGAQDGALQEGQPVEYEIERTPRGLQAVDLVALA